MTPAELFNHCPKCGAASSETPGKNPFSCAACGLVYFFNPSIAAAAIALRGDGKALFIRRAKEPAKGKLAIPGGFVDIGERAEDALRREFMEEVKLPITEPIFICSQTNDYHYGDVTYPVTDLYFTAVADESVAVEACDEVTSCHWADPSTVDLDEIAFPSMRKALELYLASKSN